MDGSCEPQVSIEKLHALTDEVRKAETIADFDRIKGTSMSSIPRGTLRTASDAHDIAVAEGVSQELQDATQNDLRELENQQLEAALLQSQITAAEESRRQEPKEESEDVETKKAAPRKEAPSSWRLKHGKPSENPSPHLQALNADM